MSVSEFFRWWRTELAGMLPEGVRRRLARRHDTLMLTMEGDQISVGRRGNGRREELGPGEHDQG